MESLLPTMSARAPNLVDYESLIRTWERTAPLHRRILARIGLQGKIILAFSLLLMVAVVGCYTMFVAESQRLIARTSIQSTLEVAHTLARTTGDAMLREDRTQLARVADRLLRHPDTVGIAFFSPDGRTIASAGPVSSKTLFLNPAANPQTLSTVHQITSTKLGPMTTMTLPVIVDAADTAISVADGDSTRQLAGYVAVARSEHSAQIALRGARAASFLVGAIVLLLSLPVVFALVHRIFFPIRQLVNATHAIASGNIDTAVAIHRPDTIGVLARAFNQMTLRIKRQQQDLADANEQLAKANRELEDRIEQRTAELVGVNQRLSAEIAEKEDFLRAVSHDLNAPLRNISGMAAMLLTRHRDTLAPDVIHRLDRIGKNVQVSTDLIGELLELSRIKTRRQALAPVDVRPLLDDLADMFENDLRTHNIQLSFDTLFPTLHCERARLRQVFQNLIDNAIKYMGPGIPDPNGGKPRREIHIGASINPRQATFYVADTGMGIEPQDRDRVFFVFRRGRQTDAHGIAGKGVGLASVKSIVETYGGTIHVQSEPGQGSSFRFSVAGQYVVRESPTPPKPSAPPSGLNPANMALTGHLSEPHPLEVSRA